MKSVQLLLSLGALFLSIYGLLCLYLYLNQDRLIFFPVQADAHTYKQWQAMEYNIPVDGQTLQGWHLQKPAAPHRAIFYFGGNAEDVVYKLYGAGDFEAGQLFFTNYRGYGQSTGTASQATLYSDALRVVDQLVEQHQLEKAQLIIMGRSLGASVAAYVASQRPVAGLIMVTPFDSLASLAGHYYPWFPVHWLLRHRFDNVQHMKHIKAPVLILAAERDEIIPRSHLDTLIKASPAHSQTLVIARANHQDISQYASYFQAINRFLTGLGGAR